MSKFVMYIISPPEPATLPHLPRLLLLLLLWSRVSCSIPSNPCWPQNYPTQNGTVGVCAFFARCKSVLVQQEGDVTEHGIACMGDSNSGTVIAFTHKDHYQALSRSNNIFLIFLPSSSNLLSGVLFYFLSV